MRDEKIRIVEEYLVQYAREYDHYAKVASIVQQKLEGLLSNLGIRAIVTSRAKSIPRLRGKLQRRYPRKQYQTTQAIQEDLIDLAGVRVALYFPGDRTEVSSLISEQFTLVRQPKVFPEEKRKSSFQKRFQGYIATHYLVRLRPEKDGSVDERYCTAAVEIQVASVLMHAWSEVEHDLEYKPESGTVSAEESAILDELNGLILTGELTLERLQEAVRARVRKQSTGFENQYDLANFLTEKVGLDRPSSKNVGRVDVLFSLLKRLGLDKSEQLTKEIGVLADPDRSISDQIIDKLISRGGDAGDEARRALASVIAGDKKIGSHEKERAASLGRFIGEWQKLEAAIDASLPEGEARKAPFVRKVEKLGLTGDLRERIMLFRDIRNSTVHMGLQMEAKQLDDFSDFLARTVLVDLRRALAAKPKPVKQAE